MFESVRNCAFIADYTLLMVDELDQFKVYDFKKRALAEVKLSLLEELGQSYCHIDGSVIKNGEKLYYLSYASPKTDDENSTVSKTQLISLFEISFPDEIEKVQLTLYSRKVVDEDEALLCYEGNQR